MSADLKILRLYVKFLRFKHVHNDQDIRLNFNILYYSKRIRRGWGMVPWGHI